MKQFSAIALRCVFIGHTGPRAAEQPERLVYLGSHCVYDKAPGLREPSGLSFDETTSEFWTVSDDTRHVFRIDQTGEITEGMLKIHDLVDAECIATTGADQLLVLSEDQRALPEETGLRRAGRFRSFAG